MTNLIAHGIDLFKVVVAAPTNLVLTNARNGFITNFTPTTDQVKVLKEKFKGLPIVTLFSVRERETASIEELLTKQILHYIEVYGLDAPGLFNLEVEGGKIETIAYIRGVSLDGLETLVQTLLYSNRPVADVVPIVELIRGYGLSYDINKIQNNELKVALFDAKRDVFKSGDDVVRYICYVATTKPLLIKSEEVIKLVKAQLSLDKFLETHVVPLAKVFNRHQRIIMACKNHRTRSTINKISRLSKTLHVPMVEPVAKRLVSGFVRNEVSATAVDEVSIRDKFKFLNLIEWKLQGRDFDTFIIRNGRVWFEKDRKTLDPKALTRLSDVVVESLKKDLSGLSRKNILLDPTVDYGLPISRKQTLGNLPFGTRVKADLTSDRFSAGVYWHNNFGDGGSIDLDLSAIDDKGTRTGWGTLRGYTGQDIVFSGDITSAPNGATEFMTVNPTRKNRYGLMVNIFNGPEPCDCEIVVGTSTSENWLETAFIRERASLASKQSIIGFIKDDSFVIYSGRLSNARVSGGKHPVIDKGLGSLWTVGDVLSFCGIRFDTAPQPGVTYDHDLTYAKFSLDKLEGLLGV